MAGDRQKATALNRDAGPEPWHRRPDESSAAYAYFRAYRDLGPGRKVMTVARHFGKNPSHLYRLSHRFDWEARAASYDLSQEREDAAERCRVLLEVARRQREEVDRLRGLPLAGLSKWANRDPVTGEWTLDPKVKPRDMVSLLSLLWETEAKAAAAESGPAAQDEPDTEGPSPRTSLSRPELEKLLVLARERAQQE